MTDPAPNLGPRRLPPSRLRAAVGAIARITIVPLWGLLWLAMTSWCALAIWFAPSMGDAVRGTLAGGFVLGLVVVLFLPRRLVRVSVPLAAWSLIVAWFWWTPPSNDRAWQPDVKVTPRIERDGDRIVVRGVRNFRYRSETDADQQWEDREYDLGRLASVDLFMSYWGPDLICHTFVSFGFDRPDGGADQICVSIETRKEVGEEYSALAGAFRRFELVHVWADECDVVRLRTDIRHEDVYRYRLAADGEGRRRLLLAYIDRANRLADEPEWYNAVTQSCGVGIVRLAWKERVALVPPLRVAFNGLWDRYAYDHGVLDTSQPFAAVRQAARVNDLVRGTSDADFSRRLRAREISLTRPLGPQG